MKKSFPFIAIAIFLALAGFCMAQNSASLSVNESATISQPIRIYKLTDLNFGGITAGLIAGTAHVTGSIGVINMAGPSAQVTTNAVIFSGGSTGPSAYIGSSISSKAAPQVPGFIVTGEPGFSYGITISPVSTFNGLPAVQDASGHSMIVAFDPPSGGKQSNNGLTGTIQTNGEPGTDKFIIGATLNIGAMQASGIYTGSFNVTVAYN